MKERSYNDKVAVLMAMKFIRQTFHEHGYDVERYSNNAIADALLEICSARDQLWLTRTHLRRAVRRLKRGTGGWLRALGFRQR